jgi:3-oxoadipate enol-lactonase
MMDSLCCVRSGSGKPVVLLHPIGLDNSFWGSLIATLSDGYSVVALDLRGHGKSPEPIREYTLVDYAADVTGFIKAHSIQPAILIGLSFGGMIAQTLALNYPELVSSLVLCGCPSRFPDEARPQVAERGMLAEREGMQAVVDATLKRWFTASFIEEGRTESVRQRLLMNNPLGWTTGWQAISALNTHDGLGGIQIPTLCLAGELDQAVPPTVVEELARAIPNSRFEVLKDTPHMMQIKRPAHFAAAIRAFLKDAESA